MAESDDEAAEIDAALLAIEDHFVWDTATTLREAMALEVRATGIDDVELTVRARLCQANMWMRQGQVGVAAQRVGQILQWAEQRGVLIVQARAHLVLANVYRHLGDFARCLEHSLLAVELLDRTATPHTQIWHRLKLADALALSGSMEAARARYDQAEQMCRAYQQHRLHMAVLNNRACTELLSGSGEEAQRAADQLQTIATTHGFPLDPADYDTVGKVLLAGGRFAEAAAMLRQAIEGERQRGLENADSLAEYHLTLAVALRHLVRHDEAQAALDASRRLCADRDLGEVVVRVLQEQAELRAARGCFADAYATYKEFFAAYQRQQSSQREAQARTRQAMFETLEARQDAERFREQARRDPLTGLYNRRFVDEQLPSLLDRYTNLAAAVIDLDHFKRINDELSHEVGDQVLRAVAHILDAAMTGFRDGAFAARHGGEEFLIVLPGMTRFDAFDALEDLRIRVRSYPWHRLCGSLPVTISIGVADTTELPGSGRSELMARADLCLYGAKRGGRDRVVMSPPSGALTV